MVLTPAGMVMFVGPEFLNAAVPDNQTACGEGDAGQGEQESKA